MTNKDNNKKEIDIKTPHHPLADIQSQDANIKIPEIDYHTDILNNNNNTNIPDTNNTTSYDDWASDQAKYNFLYDDKGNLKDDVSLKEYIKDIPDEEEKLKIVNRWKKEAFNTLDDEDKKEFLKYYSDVNNVKSRDDADFFIDYDSLNNLIYEPNTDGSSQIIPLKKLGTLIQSVNNSVVGNKIQNYYLEQLKKGGFSDDNLQQVKDKMAQSGYFIDEGKIVSGISDAFSELGEGIGNLFKKDKEILQKGILDKEEILKYKDKVLYPGSTSSAFNKDLGTFNKALDLYIENNPDDKDVKKYLKIAKDGLLVNLVMPDENLISKVIDFNNKLKIGQRQKNIATDLAGKKGSAWDPYLATKNITKTVPATLAGTAVTLSTGGIGTLGAIAGLSLGLASQAGINALTSYADNNRAFFDELKNQLENDGVDLTDEEQVNQALVKYQDDIYNNKKTNLKSSIKEGLITIPLGLVTPVLNKMVISSVLKLSGASNKVLSTAGKVLSNKTVAITASTINDSVVPTTISLMPSLARGDISLSDLVAYNLQNVIGSAPIAPLQIKAYRELYNQSKILKDFKKNIATDDDKKNTNTDKTNDKKFNNDSNNDTSNNTDNTTDVNLSAKNNNTNTDNISTNKTDDTSIQKNKTQDTKEKTKIKTDNDIDDFTNIDDIPDDNVINTDENYKQIEAVLISKALDDIASVNPNPKALADIIDNAKNNKYIDKDKFNNQIEQIIKKHNINKDELIIDKKQDDIIDNDVKNIEKTSKDREFVRDLIKKNKNIIVNDDASIPEISQKLVDEVSYKLNTSDIEAKKIIIDEYINNIKNNEVDTKKPDDNIIETKKDNELITFKDKNINIKSKNNNKILSIDDKNINIKNKNNKNLMRYKITDENKPLSEIIKPPFIKEFEQNFLRKSINEYRKASNNISKDVELNTDKQRVNEFSKTRERQNSSTEKAVLDENSTKTASTTERTDKVFDRDISETEQVKSRQIKTDEPVQLKSERREPRPVHREKLSAEREATTETNKTKKTSTSRKNTSKDSKDNISNKIKSKSAKKVKDILEKYKNNLNENIKKNIQRNKDNITDDVVNEVLEVATKSKTTKNKTIHKKVDEVKSNVAVLKSNKDKVATKTTNKPPKVVKVELKEADKNISVPEKVVKQRLTDDKKNKLSNKAKDVLSYVKNAEDNNNKNYAVVDRDTNNLYILNKNHEIVSEIPIILNASKADGISNNKAGLMKFRSGDNDGLVYVNNHAFERIINKVSKQKLKVNADKNYINKGLLDIPTSYYDEHVDTLDDANIYVTSKTNKWIDDDLMPFSANNINKTKTSKPILNKEKVKNIVDSVIPDADNVYVFDDISELKPDARARFNNFKDNNIEVWGWYDPKNNNIYVDNSKINGVGYLSPEQQLKMVLKHELTHKHTRDYLEAQNLINITKNNKFIQEALEPISDRWNLDLSTKDGHLRATEELIAELSASMSENDKFNYMKDNYNIDIPKEFRKDFIGSVSRAIDYLRGFFGKLSGSEKITNADLYNLIKNLGNGYGDKNVQKVLHKVNKLKSKTDKLAYDFEKPLTLQEKPSNGSIDNVNIKLKEQEPEGYKYNPTNTYIDNLIATSKIPNSIKKYIPNFAKLNENFVKNVANWTYPLERFLDQIGVKGDTFNQSEMKEKSQISTINNMFKDIVDNKFSKAIEILKANNKDITNRDIEQHLYEYTIAFGNLKHNRNTKLFEKHKEMLINLGKQKNEYLELIKNENLKPDIKKLIEREIRRINRIGKQWKDLYKNSKLKNNKIRTKEDIADTDQYYGGMNDAESKAFIEKFKSEPYYKDLVKIYDDILEQIYEKRKSLLEQSVKEGNIDESNYKNLLKDKYWITNEEKIVDKDKKAYFDGLNEISKSSLLYSFNQKAYDVHGRATPPTNLVTNMSNSLGRLATKSAYNQFVRKLMKHSSYDVDISYDKQVKSMLKDPIKIIPSYAKDFVTTDGFLVTIENKLGNKLQHKVSFNDELLNKILFEKPELLINKDGKIGQAIRFIDDFTRLSGKTITMRPLKSLDILYKSQAEEITLINNNSGNTIFKDINLTHARATAEFVNKSKIYVKAIDAIDALQIGDKKTYEKIVNKYDLNGLNSDIFNAVKASKDEGLTTKYEKSLQRNPDEDYIIDVNKKDEDTKKSKIRKKAESWAEKAHHIFNYGEQVNRSIITKMLRDEGYSYEQAVKFQREAMNNLKTSYSTFAQYMKIATPFSRSIATSNFYNYKSLIKAPKNALYNVLNKASKLMIANAIITYAVNPSINAISNVLTGKDDDYEIADKYYYRGIPVYLPFGSGSIFILPYGFGLSAVIGGVTELVNKPLRSLILDKNHSISASDEVDTVFKVAKKFIDEVNPIGSIDIFKEDEKNIIQSTITTLSPTVTDFAVELGMGINKYGVKSDRVSVHSKVNADVMTRNLIKVVKSAFDVELNSRDIENTISYIPFLSNITSTLKKSEQDGVIAGLFESLGGSSEYVALTEDKKINNKFYEYRQKFKLEYETAESSREVYKKNKDKINRKAYNAIKTYITQSKNISRLKYKDKDKEMKTKDEKIIKAREKLNNKLSDI